MLAVRKIKLLMLVMALSNGALLGGCGGGGESDVVAAPAPPPVSPSPAPAPVPSPLPAPAPAPQPSPPPDGIRTQAQFNMPRAVAVDRAGAIYVADTGNHTVRKLSPDGSVVTVAGSTGVAGSSDGIGAAARFSAPQGIAVDAAGNVFVADTGNHTIRRIDPAGSVTTVAGATQQPGDVDGSRAVARLNTPVRIAVGFDGDLFVADRATGKVRRIASNGDVSSFFSGRVNGPPTGLAVDGAGNLFVAWNASTVGGSTIRKFNREGTQLSWPDMALDPFATPYASDIAIGADGTVYVASGGSVLTGRDDGGYASSISKITVAGAVTMIAGNTGKIGTVDGVGTQATFDRPTGISIGGNSLVIADTGNNTIRRLDLATGLVSTLAGGPAR